MFPRICERYKISKEISEVQHCRCRKAYEARSGLLVFNEEASRKLQDCPFDECEYKHLDFIPEESYVGLHQLPLR